MASAGKLSGLWEGEAQAGLDSELPDAGILLGATIGGRNGGRPKGPGDGLEEGQVLGAVGSS